LTKVRREAGFSFLPSTEGWKKFLPGPLLRPPTAIASLRLRM